MCCLNQRLRCLLSCVYCCASLYNLIHSIKDFGLFPMFGFSRVFSRYSFRFRFGLFLLSFSSACGSSAVYCCMVLLFEWSEILSPLHIFRLKP